MLPGMDFKSDLLAVLHSNITISDYYYYYWDGSTAKNFPVHDPCGRTGQNQKKNVQNPFGAVFLR